MMICLCLDFLSSVFTISKLFIRSSHAMSQLPQYSSASHDGDKTPTASTCDSYRRRRRRGEKFHLVLCCTRVRFPSLPLLRNFCPFTSTSLSCQPQGDGFVLEACGNAGRCVMEWNINLIDHHRRLSLVFSSFPLIDDASHDR